MRIRICSYNSAATLGETETVNEGVQLAELSLSEGTLRFRPEVTQYSVQVDADVTRILVNASAAEEDSFYTVSGNSNLKQGYNTITVTVTDSKGEIGTYTIQVLVGEAPSPEQTTEAFSAEALQSSQSAKANIWGDNFFDTAENVIETVTTGNVRYVTYGVAACGMLAVVLWIAFIISRISARRKRLKARQERLRRKEARRQELELAQKQQEELLQQVDSLLEKKNKNSPAAQYTARIPRIEQSDEADDYEDYGDEDEDEIDEELERWLNSLSEDDADEKRKDDN